MRLLTKADVLTENKLFATVDSTVRKVAIENIPFLLSDTVGFIRKLPHHLIESFKSTLDEIREADILLHVVDISHPGFQDHIEIVNRTLAEIKADHKPTILVFNKTDLLKHTQNGNGSKQEDNFDPKTLLPLNQEFPFVFISAVKKENIDQLREMMLKKIRKKHYKIYPNYYPGY
jgi:GTP-binding protein HflX